MIKKIGFMDPTNIYLATKTIVLGGIVTEI